MKLDAKEQAALDRFDRHMVEATGHSLHQYERIRAAGPAALAHIQLYGSLIDESGVVDLLEQWAKDERKSNAGRKPYIPFRAVLILHLMHTDDGSNRFNDVARTLYARLSPAAFTYLGITKRHGTQTEWYVRYWRSLNRLLKLVSPWQVPRNTFLSARAYRKAMATYSQERRDRMELVMNRLAHASVRRLPKEIRATYKGNIALDATPIKLKGRPNLPIKDLTMERWNLDAMSGPYKRKGNHQGSGSKKNDAAWEVETVVTVANSPAERDSFPVLATGLAMHAPGRIKHGPLIAMNFHAELFTERGFVMVDRAYNNLRPHRFQAPIRMMGFRTVYDFKKNRLGVAVRTGNVILIAGSLYVKWMPRYLQNAHVDYAAGRIDKTTLKAYLKERTAYRCTEKGRPDHNGDQYFFYPDLTNVMCLDPVTDRAIKPRLPSQTFKLSMNTAEGMRIVQSLQSFEYKTDKWRKWMGLRSHVEGNNQHMKDDAHAALGSPEKRRPRGYAFQALAAASAIVASNMRRIVTFLKKRLSLIVDQPTQRWHRRAQEEQDALHLSALLQ